MSTADKQHRFWEQMAARYPAPCAEESLAKSSKIISRAEQRGVQIDGAVVLDIGCGTGVYTLPLAKRAARVVGLDLSAAMLRRLEAERQEQGLENISTVHGAWTEAIVAQHGQHGLDKAFDIVWAAMTPAVRSAADLARMNRCSRGWCVYIGWGGVRRNPLMEEAFHAHGLTFGPPPGAKAMQAALAGMGIDAPIETIPHSWQREESVEESCEHVRSFIEAQSEAVPQAEIIRKLVCRCADSNGRVRHQTEMEMGMMVWQTA